MFGVFEDTIVARGKAKRRMRRKIASVYDRAARDDF
jgi:hypothetical protein